MKRILAIVWISVIIIPNLFASTKSDAASVKERNDSIGRFSEKAEVVYVTLDENGNETGMYVVNRFVIDQPGKIVDYGPYSSVENVTDLQTIEQKGDEITFTANDDYFYYKGEVEPLPLPWDIDLTYQFNGKKGSPQEMLGKSGQFEMEITIGKNDEAVEGYFENYMLQMNILFDTDIFKHLQADEGVIAHLGKNQQVTFTVMPGQEKLFTIVADVEKFQMNRIDFSALPATLSIGQPDTSEMTHDLQSLSDATFDLFEGLTTFRQGLEHWMEGFDRLQDGSSKYKTGLQKLDEGAEQLTDGADSFLHALETLNNQIPSYDRSDEDLQFLQRALSDMAEGVSTTLDGLTFVKEEYDKAYETFDESIRSIPTTEISEADLQQLFESNADRTVLEKLIENFYTMQTVKETYFTSQQAFQTISQTFDNFIHFLHDLTLQLQQMASELEETFKLMSTENATAEFRRTIQTFIANFQSFRIGMNEYVENVQRLSKTYDDIDNGINELTHEKERFMEGAYELQTGAYTIYDVTKHLPDQVDEEVKKMMHAYDKSDYKPNSFVSKKNGSITSVQFYMKTDEWKLDIENTHGKQSTNTTKGFLEKLIDLFKRDG
ncbi:hypothetical protein [Fervidibacillus albus]|uniref:YhgE/Pip domain-containing protein n=1 Tax=Fervidibacillus albus TaxID=2980026 RepID=A0A9E8RWJ6_9BACI|nr:hypothetical protein [Fervidibacillus albus]WAA10143.1 hypothetical protein OE104_02010 [Fervidibacillus albus]